VSELLKKIIPNVSLNRVTLNGHEKDLKVDLDLFVQEKLTNNELIGWFKSENVVDALKVYVYSVTDPALVEKVKNMFILDIDRNALSNEEGITRSIIDVFNPEEDNLSSYGSEKVSGELMINIPLTKTLNFNSDINNLTVLFVPVVDLSFISESIEPKYAIGKLKTAKILVDDELLLFGTIFKTVQGQEWTKEVHQFDGTWYTGEFHGQLSDEQSLVTEPVLNNVVHDFRENNKKAVTEQTTPPFLLFELEEKKEKRNNPKFVSDIFLSLKQNNDISYLFFVNVLEALKAKSAYSNLLDNISEAELDKVLSRTKITSIRLNRKRVTQKRWLNRSGIQGVINWTYDINVTEDLIAETSQGNAGSITPYTGDNGSIQEVSVYPYITKKIRALAGIDKGLYHTTDGFYEYSIVVRLEDGMINYVSEKVEELLEARDRLREYSNIAQGYDIKNKRTYFNHLSKVFEENFEEEKIDPVEMGNLKGALDIYINTFRMFAPNKHTATNSILWALISPKSGTLEGIEYVILLLEALVYQIEEMGVLNVVTETNYQALVNNEQVVSSSKFMKTIELETSFEHVFDSNFPRDLGYVFFDELDGDSVDEQMSVLPKEKFEEQANKELEKYFFDENDDINISAQGQKVTEDDSAKLTKLKFFTPSKIKLPQLQPEPFYSDDKPNKNVYNKAAISALYFNEFKNSPFVPMPVFNGIKQKPVDEEYVHTLAKEIISKSHIDITKPIDIVSSAIVSSACVQDAQEGVNTSFEDAKDNQVQPKAPVFGAVALQMVLPKVLGISKKSSKTLSSYKDYKTKKPTIQKYNLGTFVNLLGGLEFVSKKEKSEYIKKLPNQIKTLFVSATEGTESRVKKNWNKANDPFKDFASAAEFAFHHLMINEVQQFVGFEEDKNGNVECAKPIWKSITKEALEKNPGVLLCRIVEYENKKLQIEKPSYLQLPVYNGYFLLDTGNIFNIVEEENKKSVVKEKRTTSVRLV